jgi:hypothetical protein
MVAATLMHTNREHIAGYGFLFAIPWAWLLDRGWFGNVHSRWLEELVGYVIILWIPALLYSGCLWLLLVTVRIWRAPRRARANKTPV